jgi:predicted lipoprotein with Yx(FWY)xxD motif
MSLDEADRVTVSKTQLRREGLAHGWRQSTVTPTGGADMSRVKGTFSARGPRAIAIAIATITGFATAALVGVALAKTFTVKVAKNAEVTNQAGSTTTESIVVSHGFAVYELTGDSARHPECTKGNSCFMFWPPVKVSSARKLSKAPGIHGRLGVWRRNGFLQLTLAGHPLYRYAGDSQRDHATGQGIQSFGGRWHVVKAATGTTSAGTTTTTTTMTSTTTPPSCLYPPCY